MSLILDALHRSDQERDNVNVVPGIQTRHGGSDIIDIRARLLMTGAAVLLVLALLVWLFIAGEPVKEERGVAVPAAAPVTGKAPPAVAVAPELPAGPAVAPPVTEDTASSPVTLPEQPVQTTPEVALPAEVAALYQREERVATPNPAARPAPVERASKTLPVEAIVAAARQELIAPVADDDPTPLVKDLPQQTKDAIPSIFFTTHSWSSRASEKMVTLNGEIRREGDTVLPGLRLVEILPESIILDFQGTRFRLRALNSWVNL